MTTKDYEELKFYQTSAFLNLHNQLEMYVGYLQYIEGLTRKEAIAEIQHFIDRRGEWEDPESSYSSEIHYDFLERIKNFNKN